MSFSFYFEDGLGIIIDELGNDPMEITENEDPFKLEELSSYSTNVALRTRLIDVEVMQECQAENPTNVDEKLSSSKQKNSLKGNRISDEIKHFCLEALILLSLVLPYLKTLNFLDNSSKIKEFESNILMVLKSEMHEWDTIKKYP